MVDRGVVVAETSHSRTVIEDAAPQTVATKRDTDEVAPRREPAQAEVPSTREIEGELAPMYYI